MGIDILIQELVWLYTSVLGLGQLCLNLPVLCYASNSWKWNYYASEEAVLCSHYAQLCNFDPRAGPSHLADYGCMQL